MQLSSQNQRKERHRSFEDSFSILTRNSDLNRTTTTEIVRGKNRDFITSSLKHRGSGLAFKDLFLGDEGTPENFIFNFVQQGIFFFPRHKHNFEQFRYAYQGDVSLGPDMILREGELSYHPEGVEYGPQSDTEGERKVLVLQFGGPSGQGFLSYAQLKRGQEKLSQLGRFENGKYYAADGSDPKDGFGALWENYNGRRLEFPPPRYDGPIIMQPVNFDWTPLEGASGVYQKELGVFTRSIAGMIKMEAGGRLQLGEKNAIRLFLILKGEGQANGENTETETALRLRRGTGAPLSSSSSIELIYFVLPTRSKPAQNNHAA